MQGTAWQLRGRMQVGERYWPFEKSGLTTLAARNDPLRFYFNLARATFVGRGVHTMHNKISNKRDRVRAGATVGARWCNSSGHATSRARPSKSSITVAHMTTPRGST